MGNSPSKSHRRPSPYRSSSSKSRHQHPQYNHENESSAQIGQATPEHLHALGLGKWDTGTSDEAANTYSPHLSNIRRNAQKDSNTERKSADTWTDATWGPRNPGESELFGIGSWMTDTGDEAADTHSRHLANVRRKAQKSSTTERKSWDTLTDAAWDLGESHPVRSTISPRALHHHGDEQHNSWQREHHRIEVDQPNSAALPVTVTEVLRSLRTSDVWLSNEQDVSWGNRVKCWVEDTSGMAWTWWPLQPRKRPLQPGEWRLFWNCPCGSLRWEELTVQQYEQVKSIMSQRGPEGEEPYWCPSRNLGNSLSGWISSFSSPWNRSTASRLYTPQNDPASSSTPQEFHPYKGIGAKHVSGAVGQNRVQQGESENPRKTQPILTAGWILLGVERGSRVFPVSQVRVDNYSTDYSVFQEMNATYRRNRGWLRLLFSIWRLRNYESVKFWRVTLKDMVPDYKDLPQNQEYKYTPRPGSGATNPPISNHVFERLSYTCPSPCNRYVPHDCLPAPSNSSFRDRIPKREKEFERDMTEFIWGLEAQFAVSALYVLGYHVVILLGPFVFWWVWLRTHVDDVQGAGVPITVALAGLSLFWSSGGILTNGKAP